MNTNLCGQRFKLRSPVRYYMKYDLNQPLFYMTCMDSGFPSSPPFTPLYHSILTHLSIWKQRSSYCSFFLILSGTLLQNGSSTWTKFQNSTKFSDPLGLCSTISSFCVVFSLCLLLCCFYTGNLPNNFLEPFSKNWRFLSVVQDYPYREKLLDSIPSTVQKKMK